MTKNPEEETSAEQTMDGEATNSEATRPDATSKPEDEVDNAAPNKKDDFFDMEAGRGDGDATEPKTVVESESGGEGTQTQNGEAEAAADAPAAEADPPEQAAEAPSEGPAPPASDGGSQEQQASEAPADNPPTEGHADEAQVDNPSEAQANEAQGGDPSETSAGDPPAVTGGSTVDASEDATDGGTAETQANTEDTPAQEESQALAVPETDNRVPPREDDYEEDFSEMSEKSGGAAAAVVVTEDRRSVESKSPSPSSKDEPRAEAGAVVPVPVPAVKSDGRSREEGGEARGEDRSEVQGDGGDNTRGTGQWKSEEQAYMESSLLKQHAEQEALQSVIDEKAKVQREFDELKVKYLALEESSQKYNEEIAILKEKCQKQEARIKELEAEEARLREYESWGKNNEAKVKDLQERLAILAGEDAEKDRRIQKLEEDLRDTNSRLINAERQAAIGAEAMQQENPKSKTCVVM